MYRKTDHAESIYKNAEIKKKKKRSIFCLFVPMSLNTSALSVYPESRGAELGPPHKSSTQVLFSFS